MLKRVLRAIPTVLKVLLIIFSAVVLIFTLLSNFVFDKDEGLLGFKMYMVLSNSMQGVFSAGDIAVSQEVKDKSTLKEGDVITFLSIDPTNYGEVVTHKIRQRTEITDNRDGQLKPAFITYGTATGVDDQYPTPEEYVLGKYIFAIPKAGYIFGNLKTPTGYLFIVLLPFGLLIGFEGANFLKLFKQYKREVKDESDHRVSDLESENIKLRKAMEELEELKRQAALADKKEEEEKIEEVVEETVEAVEEVVEEKAEEEQVEEQSEEQVETEEATVTTEKIEETETVEQVEESVEEKVEEGTAENSMEEAAHEEQKEEN